MFKKVLKSIRIILITIFLLIALLGSFYRNNDSESLLNDPIGIVVDQKGWIYCASTNPTRVNIYNDRGIFVRNIKVNSEGGVFRLKIQNTHLMIATVRNQMLYEFSDQGNLISQEKRAGVYESFDNINEKQCTDVLSNVYQIKNPLFIYPHINKITPTGQKTTIVSVPFNKWIFMEPYPSWHFIFFGMVLLALDFFKLQELLKKLKDRA